MVELELRRRTWVMLAAVGGMCAAFVGWSLFSPADMAGEPMRFEDRLEDLARAIDLRRGSGSVASSLRHWRAAAEARGKTLNAENLSSEALWMFLVTDAPRDLVHLACGRFSNADRDILGISDGRASLGEVFEFVDVLWNPILYMDRELLDEISDPQTVVTSYRRTLRVSLPANLRDDLLTGRRGNVLWSAGPDEEYGTADDVVR